MHNQITLNNLGIGTMNEDSFELSTSRVYTTCVHRPMGKRRHCVFYIGNNATTTVLRRSSRNKSWDGGNDVEGSPSVLATTKINILTMTTHIH